MNFSLHLCLSPNICSQMNGQVYAMSQMNSTAGDIHSLSDPTVILLFALLENCCSLQMLKEKIITYKEKKNTLYSQKSFCKGPNFHVCGHMGKYKQQIDIKRVQYTITVTIYATPSDMHIINNQIYEGTKVGVERVGPVSDVAALLQVQIYYSKVRSSPMANFISCDLQTQKHILHTAKSRLELHSPTSRSVSQSIPLLGCSHLGNCRSEWCMQVQHGSRAAWLCEHTRSHDAETLGYH